MHKFGHGGRVENPPYPEMEYTRNLADFIGWWLLRRFCNIRQPIPAGEEVMDKRLDDSLKRKNDDEGNREHMS